MFPEYKSKNITAKVIAELPRSSPQFAYQIDNFDVDHLGHLSNKFAVMPLIPDEWNDGVKPTPFGNVIGMACVYLDGGFRPEILFFCTTGVFRYTPWSREAGSAGFRGLEEQFAYREGDSSTYSVKPTGRLRYPVQSVSIGNRVYFNFCDGNGTWIWDGYRIRKYGFESIPSPPNASGPSRQGSEAGVSQPNAGGFSHQGRIGTISGDLVVRSVGGTEEDIAVSAGGISDGEWSYHVVFEGPDGSYSATSPAGGKCTVRQAYASSPDVTENPTFPEELRRQFWVHNIPTGPIGTAARILLRTPDHLNVTTGLDFRPRFLMRIPNNLATEYVDNTPDLELGDIWEDREATPVGVYFLSRHSGSLFLLRTDGNPSRIWWSELTPTTGGVPESILKNHWMDIYPETGAITGARSVNIRTADATMASFLIFKEAAVHYVGGEYPQWRAGTLHSSAGMAGPNLIQVTADNHFVWYGNKTFWHLDTTTGTVADVGLTIKKSLSRINEAKAGSGVSWIKSDTKEIYFCLPVEDSTTPNKCFIWDHRFGGFRTRSNIKVNAALSIPKMGLSLFSGSVDVSGKGDEANVWIQDRGYPTYPVSQPTATYKSSWVSLSSLEQVDTNDPIALLTQAFRSKDRLSSSSHAFNNATDLIVTMKESSSGSFSVSTYQDWDVDNYIDADTMTLYHPEQESSIPFFGSDEYSSINYRESRTFSERIALGVGSAGVFQVLITTTSPTKILNIDVFGPTVALPGGRTP